MNILQVDPEMTHAFIELHRAVFSEGALDQKTKELIALATALTTGCERCFEAHTQRARNLGASDQEIREAIGVAEIMSASQVRSLVSGSSIQAQSEQDDKA